VAGLLGVQGEVHIGVQGGVEGEVQGEVEAREREARVLFPAPVLALHMGQYYTPWS